MKTAILFAGALVASAAHAHVTLEQSSAPAGAYQKLTFRVGHGCQGSATHTLIVKLPEAIAGAKPMPKAGWTINSADAREISWKGGPLADAHYDEFSMQVKLPEVIGKQYFKVTQLCEKGRADWVELPGATGVALKSPAPAIDIVPAAAAAHQH